MKFERVAAWNAQRYEQVLNTSLQHKLLVEEFTETKTALEPVERLDGHIDQIYVAMGGLWKLGLSHKDAINFLTASEDYTGLLTVQFDYNAAMKLIQGIIANVENPIDSNHMAMIMADIINLNYIALEKLGYTWDECYQAAEIVCDSNDSKVVQKVAANVKANDGNKGSSFIDPKPRLQVIVDAMQARRQ